jgi:ATPase family associated with various cellular activities (AAA)
MITATEPQTWHEANHRYLLASLALVRNALERHLTPRAESIDLVQELQAAAAAMPGSAAIDRLCQIFGLSSFERDIVLLCAGIEFSGEFAKLCSSIHGDPQRSYPTLGMALAALPDPHWDAIVPNAALRRWQLIKLNEGSALALSPIRIDERILHYLAGMQYLDERLMGIIEPVTANTELVPSQQILADRVAAILSQTSQSERLPAIQLCGVEHGSKRSIAATACRMMGLSLCVMTAQTVPIVPAELENLIRLWTRETILSGSGLLLDCEELDFGDATRLNAIGQLVDRLRGILIISSREGLRLRERAAVRLDVQKPSSIEQNQVWVETLATLVPQLNGHTTPLVNQFNLSAATIRAACAQASGSLQQEPETKPIELLWDACRMQTRPRLDELAQRIEPGATWEDLVLPDAQKQILIDVAAHVKQRATVYETWGFASKGARGLGISALFSGTSGTGKTLAAEVLAHQLRLDLYRIDLSSVVSKYIGETEKNLRQVFDAAEQGGAILLFDEADALFGKRSEVKDAKDRYANIEVSYLLQRMECYPGLAILTTNLKSSIDTAFMRRIRFVVQFPFPDAAQRAEIWRRIFPANTPTQDLDPARLARLSVAGGNIRNIALNAAFLAADAGEAVQMKHLLRSAQSEYSKLEKPLTEAEVGGWV